MLQLNEARQTAEKWQEELRGNVESLKILQAAFDSATEYEILIANFEKLRQIRLKFHHLNDMAWKEKQHLFECVMPYHTEASKIIPVYHSMIQWGSNNARENFKNCDEIPNKISQISPNFNVFNELFCSKHILNCVQRFFICQHAPVIIFGVLIGLKNNTGFIPILGLVNFVWR